nr:sporulation protein YqfD [Paenibacillus senegalensis]
MAGSLLFLIGLFLLSSLIWKVEIEGNEKLMTDLIRNEAREMGIYELQWKFRLADADRLADQLQSRLPGTAWVGIEVQGTHVRIKVVESTSPDERDLVSPRHLVADKHAVVTKVLAEKGKPVVQPDQYVRKGDVLISGWIGSKENSQLVVSSGKVMGLVWYTSHIDIPLTQQYKTYTGEAYNRFSLMFGSRALPLNHWGEDGFEQKESLASQKIIKWRDYHLPLGWISEKVMEVRITEHSLTVEEAQQIAMERARSELLLEAGEDARIVSEKLLNSKEENGKLYLEVHFEVEEEITEELIIVPGE